MKVLVEGKCEPSLVVCYSGAKLKGSIFSTIRFLFDNLFDYLFNYLFDFPIHIRFRSVFGRSKIQNYFSLASIDTTMENYKLMEDSDQLEVNWGIEKCRCRIHSLGALHFV